MVTATSDLSYFSISSWTAPSMIAMKGVKSAGGGSEYSTTSFTSIPLSSNLGFPKSARPLPHAFPIWVTTKPFIPNSSASWAIALVWKVSRATNLKRNLFSSGFVTPRKSTGAVEDGEIITILLAVTYSAICFTSPLPMGPTIRVTPLPCRA